MTETIGEAFVAIRPDVSNFPQETQTGIKSSIGKVAAGIGGLFVLDKVKDQLVSTINAGSDLNETVNKTQVVFGDSSKAALEYGETAATALGESKQQALEQLSTLGNLFVSLGLGRRKALDMGKGMVSLAADLGSFNNVPTDEALEAIRSGLVGETEPLRRLGVNMNEATLKAKALELGLSDGTSVLTPAQKAQAAYALILDQTKTAQGDFARTSDGAANSQKILAARMENIRAKIGTALLPIYTKLLDIGQKVVAWLSEHKVVALALAGVIGGALVAAFTAWAIAAGAAAVATLTAAAPVIAIIAAIALVVAAIIFLWTNWDQVWGWIKDHPAIAIVVSILAAPIGAMVLIVGALKTLWENWDTIWNWITDKARWAWENVLSPIWEQIKNGLLVIGYVLAVLRDAWATIWGAISTAVTTAWGIINPILSGIIDAVRTVIEWVGKALDKLGALKDAAGGGGLRFPHFVPDIHLASGGFVPGTGNRDTVPAMLTPGEYVMSKDEVARGGRGETHNYYFTGQPNNPTQFVLQVAQRRRLVSSLAAL